MLGGSTCVEVPRGTSPQRPIKPDSTASPYPNMRTPESPVVVKNRPRQREQLTSKPRIRRFHDGLSPGGAKGTRTPGFSTKQFLYQRFWHRSVDFSAIAHQRFSVGVFPRSTHRRRRCSRRRWTRNLRRQNDAPTWTAVQAALEASFPSASTLAPDQYFLPQNVFPAPECRPTATRRVLAGRSRASNTRISKCAASCVLQLASRQSAIEPIHYDCTCESHLIVSGNGRRTNRRARRSCVARNGFLPKYGRRWAHRRLRHHHRARPRRMQPRQPWRRFDHGPAEAESRDRERELVELHHCRGSAVHLPGARSHDLSWGC